MITKRPPGAPPATNDAGQRRLPFPTSVAPMLASSGAHGFPATGWIYEPKLDGIRCIALIKHGKAELHSRRGLQLTLQYPTLAKSIGYAAAHDCVLDGEIVALDDLGRPSFQLLQQRMNLTDPHDVRLAEKQVPAIFFAFDVVHIGVMNLARVPLLQRKKLLEQAFTATPAVRLTSFFEGNGAAVYQACIENGFEGAVAKRADSFYEIGKRSPNWVKLKSHETSEFVIGGYTRGQGGRNGTFGALLLGRYNADGQLVYAGSVGTGFSDAMLDKIAREIQTSQTKLCPFLNRPTDKGPCAWVTPQLVCEVKFMSWTNDQKLRAPVFMRFRPDLHPADVGSVTSSNQP